MVTLWQICKCSSQEGSLRLAVLGPKQFEALEDLGSIPQLTWSLKAPVQGLGWPLLVSTLCLLSLFCLPTPQNMSLWQGALSRQGDCVRMSRQARSRHLCYQRSKYTSQTASLSWSFVFKFRWSCVVSLVTTLVGTAKIKTKVKKNISKGIWVEWGLPRLMRTLVSVPKFLGHINLPESVAAYSCLEFKE